MLLYVQSREKKTVRVQADDPVSFLQLTSKNDLGITEVSLTNRSICTLHAALRSQCKRQLRSGHRL